MYKAGKQIDGQTLYERQQESIKLQRNVVAPVIIATGLRTPDNIASVLRIADAAYSNRIVFVTDENDTVEFNNKIKRLSRSTDKGIRIEQYELDTFLNICGDLPVMIALEITTLS